MSNAYDSMDLDTAYEIAGGYINADDEVFAKALEMVKADDSRFAQELEKIRNAEQALEKKMQKEEEITAEAEEVFDNASFIKKEFDDRQLEEKFFADKEIKEAEENTEVYDVNPDTKERFELQGQEKHDHFTMLFEKAKLDVWREQVGNKEFAEKTTEEKKKSLFAEIKSSFLGTIAHLRTSAQVENEVSGAAQAIENEDKNFFVKQSGSMLQKMRKAFDLKQKIKVSSSAIMAACAESEAKTSQFAKKCTELAKKANGKNKEYFSKAAVLTHQAKEFFHRKAKEAWGQRYEFIANMKDRAPKITTNLVATGVLVGATAANASWLGAAVIGYGAYKATSAWVWPIITFARKEARLAKQDKNAPKVGFFSRLKAAPKTIFSNKELRKTYFKDAAWASAAGLVGLGAAGTIASAGGGVLVQKSVQSLSSTAVYTANSLTNAIKTLKDKQKDLWSKGLAVVSTVIMGYVMVSCGENTSHRVASDVSEAPHDSLEGKADTVPSKVVVQNTEADEVEPEVQATPVTVPSAWNENMGISSTQWENMKNYFGEKFDAKYQKITDDMLQDGGVFAGKTREQVLFEYKQLGSWNLFQHRETLAKLDSFFDGCGGSLTAEDVKSMDDVLPSGGIRDVQGSECLRVTARDTECGEAPVLHTQKVDCGCNNVNDAANEASVPEGQQPAEPVAEAPNKPQNEQTDFVQTSEFQTQTTYTQETVVTEPQVNKIKGNGLTDVNVVGQATTDDVAALDVKNKTNILVENGNDTEGFVTTESFATTPKVATVDVANAGSDQQTDFVTTESFAVAPKGATVDVTNAGSDQQTDFVTTESFVSDSNSAVTEGAPAQEQEGFIVSESFSKASENEASEVVPTTTETANEGEAVEASDLNAARGGYNNTGLTEKQYEKLESFFKNKGENAFEFYKEKITDEMLAKGGIFEGLTREQALFSYKQIVEWSNNTGAGAFKNEIIALDHYFNGCDETIEASRIANIKGLVDRVNTDGSMDGVVGNRCVQTVRYTFNDCDEKNVYSRVNADCGTTRPTGKKWERMFVKIWNKPPEPEDFVKTEEYQVVTEVQTPTVATEPDVLTFKGNNINADEVTITGQASVDDVAALDVENKEGILVENGTHSETTDAATEEAKSEVSNRAARKAAKKAAKEAQEYTAWAKANGLTGNPHLDKWIISSRER
ncbi:MAG: hypothetical protein J6J35_05390 [Alphaproteobacteria bacterium]|nr:hypothetical protein [Alphaproteobacteria bacterium]